MGADYSLTMHSLTASGNVEIVEHDGPANRLILRGQNAKSGEIWVVAGYNGPVLPAVLTRAQLSAHNHGGRAWRLTSGEGVFEFEAAAIDRIVERPELLVPLHRRFALTRKDRAAVRILLWLLRLPVGARLLRLWHGKRGS